MNHKTNYSSVFLIIPTIRNLDFLQSWGDEFRDCQIVIVEDHVKKEIRAPDVACRAIHHFSWTDIEHEFGKSEWIFPRKNAGIRSYGFWKSYQMGADVIITIDDDCYPSEKVFVKKHVDNLSFKAASNWFTTYPNPDWIYTRGIPYSVRKKIPIKVSHGLWSGAIDLDAKTEVKLIKLLNEKPYPPIRQIIPFGYYYPMCSMNLAFRREVTPLMFFPMMGRDPRGKEWGYDRYDDIWAGIFSKKIMDHLAWGVVNGSPFVKHMKTSHPRSNFKRESAGMKMNEILWKEVNEVRLTEKTALLCYIELANNIRFPRGNYFKKLREAMIIWSRLFML